MTVRELLQELNERGITLKAEGDRLRFYPRDAVDGELLERLRQHKAELLRLLQTPLQCASHLRFTDWLEAPAADRPGWLRTTCRLCGTFIGYRPTLN